MSLRLPKSYLAFRNLVAKPCLKYHCDCGRTFRKGEELLIHKELHCAIYSTWRKENRYVDCPRCQRRFNNVEEMREHFATHDLHDLVGLQDKPYICSASACAKTFPSFDLYLRHKERGCWAKPDPKLFQFDCKNCGVHFASKQVWVFHSGYCKENKMEKKHLDWHRHGIHSCPYCLKQFKKKQSWKDHVTKHVQESKFTCCSRPNEPDDNSSNENEPMEAMDEVCDQLENHSLLNDDLELEKLGDSDDLQHEVHFLVTLTCRPIAVIFQISYFLKDWSLSDGENIPECDCDEVYYSNSKIDYTNDSTITQSLGDYDNEVSWLNKKFNKTYVISHSALFLGYLV